MTLAARRERTAWRLGHLDEWRRDLQALSHYRAEYPYDAGLEYEHDLSDWTSDPDYVWHKVYLREHDAEGYEIHHWRDRDFLWQAESTAARRLGNRVVVRPDIYFHPSVAEWLNLFTRQGTPKNVTVPGLAVLLPEKELPVGWYRPLRNCVLRLHEGDAAPDLVLLRLASTRDGPREPGWRQLYAALGVLECLVYDPGGMRSPNSPAGLDLYRLENGAYTQMQPNPDLSVPGLPAVESKVFGTHLRVDPHCESGHRHDPPAPRLQWHDVEASRWRHVDRRWMPRGGQGPACYYRPMFGGEAVDYLHTLLHRELTAWELGQVAAAWRTDALPDDWFERIKSVQRTPSQWRSLLLDA